MRELSVDGIGFKELLVGYLGSNGSVQVGPHL